MNQGKQKKEQKRLNGTLLKRFLREVKAKMGPYAPTERYRVHLDIDMGRRSVAYMVDPPDGSTGMMVDYEGLTPHALVGEVCAVLEYSVNNLSENLTIVVNCYVWDAYNGMMRFHLHDITYNGT